MNVKTSTEGCAYSLEIGQSLQTLLKLPIVLIVDQWQ